MTTLTRSTWTFSAFHERLGTRQSRKVGNNTYMERLDDGSIGVRLHQTHVVVAHPDGRIILDSGGWNTPTTRDRITTWSPVRVSQRKGVAYLDDGTRFYDGMVVDDDGAVIDRVVDSATETESDAAITALQDKIRAYAKVCGEQSPMPDKGDCWYCSFMDPDGLENGHLLDHLDEGYVHGSLIVNAMRARGYQDAGIVAFIQGYAGRDAAKVIARSVRWYLSRRLVPQRQPMR